MRLEHGREGWIHASINPSTAQVGQFGSWSICLQLQRSFRPGAEFRITLPFLFRNPQMEDPQDLGYVSVSCSQPDVTLHSELAQSWFSTLEFMHDLASLNRKVQADIRLRTLSPVGRNLSITAGAAHLQSDTFITVCYGDRTSGGPGGEILPSRERDWASILVAVDPDGTRAAPATGFYRVLPSPRLTLSYGSARRMVVRIPSILPSSGTVPAIVLAYDGVSLERNTSATGILSYVSPYGHRVPLGEQTVAAQWDTNEYGVEGEFDSTQPSLTIPAPEPEETKPHRLLVCDRRRALAAKSNPVVHRRTLDSNYSSLNLFWGDLHVMNGAFWVTEAWRPKHYFEYARNGGLDFAAVTDICRETALFDADSMVSPEEWKELLDCCRTWHTPHEFITFPAYEYNERVHGGDRNVYFLNEQEACLCCWSDPRYDEPTKLWRALEGRKAMTIPHHPACTHIGQNWRYHAPYLQRLVEIYSEWGNSEGPGCRRPMRVPADYHQRSVQAALSRGYQLGFIASTDTHSGDVGEAALAAIWAPELTRESLWEALWNRHCYGTTGARIILQVSARDTIMGDRLSFGRAENSRKLQISVVGTEDIASVEVLRNNRVVYRACPSSSETSFIFRDQEAVRNPHLFPLLFYYTRVTQVDGHMAWSSPIWIDSGHSK